MYEYVKIRSQLQPQPHDDIADVVDFNPSPGDDEDVNSDLDLSNDNDSGKLLMRKFDDTLAQVRGVVSANVSDKSLRKSTEYFLKQLMKSASGNVQKLAQTFYTIGRETTAAKKTGRKKNSKTIPVQPLSRSRRLTKHRGRGRAIAGRKPQDQRKRTQFVITDDIDDVDVARSLPPQKKARSRKKHSLNANVADNVAAPLT